MVLVLILLIILIVFMSIVLLLLLSTVKLVIKDFQLNNESNHLIYKYDIFIGLYLFDKVKIFKIDINENLINKEKNTKKVEKKKADIIKEIFESIKILDIKLENIDLKLNLGIEDVIATSTATMLISTILSIIFAKIINKYDTNKYKYEVNPLYVNKNIINLKLNCIINTKLVHIIHIIYIQFKKRRGNYERTSNRRFNDNSYEQYTRYGRRKYNYRGTN